MDISVGFRWTVRLIVAGALAILATATQGESAVIEGSKAASMESCVAPTAEMRRYHMDYLKHDRDRTVHMGVRGIKNSLSGCVDCHAARDQDGDYKPVNGESQFCAGCHSFMAVRLACFQCHRGTPESDGPMVSGSASMRMYSPEQTHTPGTDGVIQEPQLTQHHEVIRGD